MKTLSLYNHARHGGIIEAVCLLDVVKAVSHSSTAAAKMAAAAVAVVAAAGSEACGDALVAWVPAAAGGAFSSCSGGESI